MIAWFACLGQAISADADLNDTHGTNKIDVSLHYLLADPFLQFVGRRKLHSICTAIVKLCCLALLLASSIMSSFLRSSSVPPLGMLKLVGLGWTTS